MDNRPIGIFDSGVGGLTVAREIYVTVPNESTIYLGDTARIPYGTRSKETVIKFAIEDVNFLIKQNVKVIVIACNTATAQAEQELKSAFEVPIFGVVEPAVNEALKITKDKKIGVIGTAGTIGSGAHERLLKSLDQSVTVVTQACPLLVPLVEDGRLGGSLVEEVVGEYLEPIRKAGVDTLILGCTHYPLLREVIDDYFGGRVNLVDAGKSVATEIADYLNKNDLIAISRASRQYFLTDLSASFRQTAEQFLDGSLPEIQKAELALDLRSTRL